MRVILLQDVPKVGRKYEIKELNDGYVLHFLFPKKWATLATPKAIAEIEKRQKEIVIEREVQANLLEKNLENIKNMTVVIKTRADEKGHLFAAVHEKQLAETLDKEHHIEISEKFILLEKPIKAVGEFEIPVAVEDKKSFFKLIVEKI